MYHRVTHATTDCCLRAPCLVGVINITHLGGWTHPYASLPIPSAVQLLVSPAFKPSSVVGVTAQVLEREVQRPKRYRKRTEPLSKKKSDFSVRTRSQLMECGIHYYSVVYINTTTVWLLFVLCFHCVHYSTVFFQGALRTGTFCPCLHCCMIYCSGTVHPRGWIVRCSASMFSFASSGARRIAK